MQADQIAANAGPNHAVGGVEYYAKMMRFNRILRERMGEEGDFLINSLSIE